MAITRKDAKLIAEELFKLLKGNVVEAAKEVTKVETEEYYTPKEVAQILKCHPVTIYKKKDELGCYVKRGGRLLFPKYRLHEVIQSGRLSGRM